MTAVAIVVAAGSGERLGADRPKALVPLAGRPLLSHALDRIGRSGVFAQIVVVHAPGHEAAFADVCRTHGVDTWVPGGATRTDSVRAGVDAAGEASVLAVHDAARALTPPEVIARTVGAIVQDVVAAAPGVPVPDTLKHVGPGRQVTATVDRAGVWAVHTPQAVRADVLREVLAAAPDDVATDDLGLVERAIAAGTVAGRVVLVEGDVRDLKVTYPRDLESAAALLAAEDRAAAPEEVRP